MILKHTASHRHFLSVTFNFLITLQLFLRICLDGVWTVPQSANAVFESVELLSTTGLHQQVCMKDELPCHDSSADRAIGKQRNDNMLNCYGAHASSF